MTAKLSDTGGPAEPTASPDSSGVSSSASHGPPAPWSLHVSRAAPYFRLHAHSGTGEQPDLSVAVSMCVCGRKPRPPKLPCAAPRARCSRTWALVYGLHTWRGTEAPGALGPHHLCRQWPASPPGPAPPAFPALLSRPAPGRSPDPPCSPQTWASERLTPSSWGPLLASWTGSPPEFTVITSSGKLLLDPPSQVDSVPPCLCSCRACTCLYCSR